MADPRITLITGATGNVGRVAAQSFLDVGDYVVLSGRNNEALIGLQATLRPFDRVEIIVSDPGHAGGAEALVTDVLHRCGRIDCLVHLIGVFRMLKISEAEPTDWDSLMHVNAFSAAHLLKLILPGMIDRGYGRGVFVTSMSVPSPPAGLGPYAASKAALEAIVKSAAREVRDNNINLNLAAVTTIDSEDVRRSMPKTDPSHFISPADLAATLVFLSSDSARSINGAVVPVIGKGSIDVRL